MKCPKCNSEMERVEYQAIEVDRCTKCKGIWFDYLEAEKLKEMKGSEIIDVGSPELFEKYDRVDNIECPKCHSVMGKMVENNQPHIWYETCDLCYGVFFDAGEFKDYKEENILDFFKDLVTRPRQ